MNTPNRLRPSERDRAIRVLRGMTLGVAIGGVAGSAAIGALAAQSYGATTGVTEVVVADATGSPDALTATVDQAAAVTTTPSATAAAAPTPTPTATPTVVSVRGGGHATTGGS